MEIYGFTFSAEDFDGYRMIKAVIPRVVDVSTLSAAISRYLELWDVKTTIVVLNDATRLEVLTEDVRPVLLAVLKRNLIHPGFLGSAWFTGGRSLTAEALRSVVVEAGRDPGSVVETEDDAMAYLQDLLSRAAL